MDSGNSGSFQSSSGEDEFDSQTDGISALLNNNQAADHVDAHSNHHHQQQPPLPPPPETPSSSYMYHNPLSNYFDLVSLPPPPPPRQPLQNHHLSNTLLINSDVDWLKTLRSQTTDQITTFQSLLGIQNPVDENTTTDAGILVSPPPPPPPTTANINAGKNPRKRSRASRRAPTTVLTTDTSNFRAMVQEFTGIPAAPPFTFTSASSSAPFTRNRFDLFGGRASHSHLISRPFPQKVQLGSSSSIIDHAIIASSNSNNNNNTTFGFGININANNPNYNYFNVPNPIVSSFLEPNYTSGFPPISSTKSHQESLDISLNDSHMKMGGGLDEYSCRVNTNTHSGVPNLIYSEDQTTIRIGNNNQDGFSWQNIGVNSSQDDDQSNFNFSS